MTVTLVTISNMSVKETFSGPTEIPDARKYFLLAYKNIAPLNLALSVLIILLNSLVIAHYYKNRSRLTFIIFVLISICDILTAAGNIVFAGGSLLWSSDSERYDGVMWWCYIGYRVVGILAYSCSIYFNTLLAVLRSITIYNPFYRPQVSIMQIVSTIYILLLLSLTAYDIYILAYLTTTKTFSDLIVFWFMLVSLASVATFPGQTISWSVWISTGFKTEPSAGIECTLLTVQYLLPVLFILVSMVVQVITGWKRARAREDTETVLIDWAHINTTVFLLAVLTFLCNTPLSISSIMIQVLMTTCTAPADWVYSMFGALQTLLPLLNAVLSPLIIVSRNERIRQDIRNYFVAIFRGQGEDNTPN